jgi:hypothetical protein
MWEGQKKNAATSEEEPAQYKIEKAGRRFKQGERKEIENGKWKIENCRWSVESCSFVFAPETDKKNQPTGRESGRSRLVHLVDIVDSSAMPSSNSLSAYDNMHTSEIGDQEKVGMEKNLDKIFVSLLNF